MNQKLRFFLLGLLLIPCWVIAVKYDIDLVNLYAAAGFAKSDPSRVYAQNGDLGRYFYGPFSLVVFRPFAEFSFATVKYFWIILQTISFVYFWRFLKDLYPRLSENWPAWLAVFVLAINPIHNNFQSNNIQLMLGALILWAEVWSRASQSSRQWWAGAILSVTAAIKVFPLFLCAYYFLAKPRRVVAGMLLGFLVTGLLPFPVFGLDASLELYRGFFANLTTYNNENSFTRVPDILCVPSLLARILADWTPAQLSLVTRATILLCSSAFFIWVLVQRRKMPNWFSSRQSIHIWALAGALMAVLNPSTRPHYFLFYVPLVASLFELLRERNLLGQIGTWLSTALIALTAQGVVGKDMNDWLEAKSFPTWGAILMILTFLGVYRRR